MAPEPALDLTTSLQGVFFFPLHHRCAITEPPILAPFPSFFSFLRTAKFILLS